MIGAMLRDHGCVWSGARHPPCSDVKKAARTKTPASAKSARDAAADQAVQEPGPVELPPAVAGALAEFNRGAANMEKYEYAKAARAFNKVLEVAPDWTAARFNRGLAYLNMAGANDPDKRLGPTPEMVETAVATFEQIVQKDPGHLPSLFCLGMLRAYLGQDEQALECFEKVYRQDGDDSFVAYSYAKALRNLDRAAEAVPILEKVIERDPGFVSAVYLLGTLYMRDKKMAEAKSLMTRFRELNQDELAVGTFVVDDKYGMAGKYYFAIGADGLPLPPQRMGPVQRVVFSPEPQAIGEVSQAWDSAGGSVRMPGVAVADVDGDGDLDLLLSGQGKNGTARILLNDGDGSVRGRCDAGRACGVCEFRRPRQ